MNEPEMIAMWKSQALTAAGPVDVAELRAQASAFQRRVARRNAIEYVAAAVLVAWVAHSALHAASPLFVAGGVLTIAGTAIVVWQMRRRASARTAPAETLGLASVAFHRGQLERQRDALRDAWLWYVLPFVPGGVVTRIAIETMPGRTMPWWGDLLIDVALVGFALGIAWLNRHAARELQRQIDALD